MKCGRLIVLIGFFLVVSTWVSAQYTQVGSGAFTSVSYGPMATVDSTPFFLRHAYIYPSASISGMEHGDTLRSIAFMRAGFDTLAGSVSFKIYLKNTAKPDFGASSLNWKSEARDSGLTLLYSGNPRTEVGNTPGLVRFEFNEEAYYVFDTTGNAIHLEMLLEYTQQTNQPNPIFWYVENRFSVTTFNSNNEGKYLSGGSANWLDSMSTSSYHAKPTVRFNHPNKRINLEMRNIYALGRYPLRMARPDTVKAIVENIGLDTVFHHKMYLEVSGVNNYLDSLVVDTLLPFEERVLRFGNYQPSIEGTETLSVYAGVDEDTTDNRNSVNRIVNYNVYTHADPFRSGSGGIGFNGSTGDFVAKFYVKDSAWINQIKVDFSSSGRSFQLGVWDDDGPGGLPGTNIFTSDTQWSVAGTFIMFVQPKIQVNGGYYVGIRQTSNTNVAFGFQFEIPVRPDVFFFAAPLGDTNWIPFSPGFNYNFNIQPRIQVNNDLAITAIRVPGKDTMIRYSKQDSLFPEVVVSNLGILDQNNVTIHVSILNQFGQSIYSDNQLINITSDSSKLVVFAGFSKYNLGNFTIKASVDLNTDSAKDNNEMEHNFSLFKNHDVAADIIFEPQSSDTFELNEDGFWPQVRIYNYGVADQANFPVRGQLLKGDSILHSETLSESLAGEQSKIIVFDSVYPNSNGWLEYRVFTDLDRDSFRQNDTTRVTIYCKKSYDVGVLSINKPLDGSKYATATQFKPFVNVRNHGLLSQDSVYIYAHIYDGQNQLIYSDTVLEQLTYFSTKQALFKTFNTPSNPDSMRFEAGVSIPKDQDLENNVQVSNFKVVDGRDLQLLSLDAPLPATVFETNTLTDPIRFTIFNNGLVDALNVPIRVQVPYNDSQYLHFENIVIDTLLAGDTVQLASSAVFLPLAGSFPIEVFNQWSQEDEPSANDTLRGTYVVQYKNDLKLDSLRDPIADELWNLNETRSPSVRVENHGFDTAFDREVLLRMIDEQQLVQYTDTVELQELMPGQAVQLIFAPFQAEAVGRWTAMAYLLQADDQTENDSLQHGFDVAVLYDMTIDSVWLPYPSQALKIKQSHQPIAWISNAGVKALDSNARLQCIVSIDTLIVYNNTQVVALDSGAFTAIKFDSSLRYPEVTEALVSFRTYYPMDLNTVNDSLSYTFKFSEKLSTVIQTLEGVSVYPNPHLTEVIVRSDQPIHSLRLFNNLGELVYVYDGPLVQQLRVENHGSAGIYFLEVEGTQGKGMYRLIKL